MGINQNQKKLISLSIGALGIVYGDIGTSPLYAVRESLRGLPISQGNVFGVLSLIFWCLAGVISFRYVTIFLQADNEGEGGVLALLALIKKDAHMYHWLFIFGVMGAGLMIGDGMLTPAISVLSAVEGLHLLSPKLAHFTPFIACVILIALFLRQHHGTAKIGSIFGPVVLFWFITIGALGCAKILQKPHVIAAVSPYYAFEFFRQNGWHGYLLLGSVFLVITGAEALYADLGHFEKTPIRVSWYFVVLPGLLLNYFGQGAHLIDHPEAIINPFYSLAPQWFYYPLLFLATLVTVIASQAVISASFSLVKQAISLNLCPRLSIIQTSEEQRGQIYIPVMNFILGIGTLFLILMFKSSSGLAGAYGLAVNMLMIIMSILITSFAYHIWGWSIWKITRNFALFILIDFLFLGANLHKLMEGGWIPIAIALFFGTVMMTWKQGMEYLRKAYFMEKSNLVDMVEQITTSKSFHIPKFTAVFITDPYDNSGGCLVRYLELNHFFPEQVLIVSTVVEKRPYIGERGRYNLKKIGNNLHHLLLHLGFMESIGIPNALSIAERMKLFPFSINLEQAVYFVEVPNIFATKQTRTLLFSWQEKLFAFLLHNTAKDIEYYRLPRERTISIGAYREI